MGNKKLLYSLILSIFILLTLTMVSASEVENATISTNHMLENDVSTNTVSVNDVSTEYVSDNTYSEEINDSSSVESNNSHDLEINNETSISENYLNQDNLTDVEVLNNSITYNGENNIFDTINKLYDTQDDSEDALSTLEYINYLIDNDDDFDKENKLVNLYKLSETFNYTINNYNEFINILRDIRNSKAENHVITLNSGNYIATETLILDDEPSNETVTKFVTIEANGNSIDASDLTDSLLFVSDNYVLTLEDANIENIISSDISIESEGVVNLNNVNITNVSTNTTLINATNSILSMNNTRIDDVVISTDDSTTEDTSNVVSALIYASNSTVSVNNTEINNIKSTSGNGVITSFNSNLNVTNSVFSNSSVKKSNYSKGGVIYQENAKLDIINSSFIDNEAVYGGSLYLVNATVDITESYFKNNAEVGSNIYSTDSILTISNSTFESDKADSIYLKNSTAYISKTTFIINENVIFVDNLTLTSNDVLSTDNIYVTIFDKNSKIESNNDYKTQVSSVTRSNIVPVDVNAIATIVEYYNTITRSYTVIVPTIGKSKIGYTSLKNEDKIITSTKETMSTPIITGSTNNILDLNNKKHTINHLTTATATIPLNKISTSSMSINIVDSQRENIVQEETEQINQIITYDTALTLKEETMKYTITENKANMVYLSNNNEYTINSSIPENNYKPIISIDIPDNKTDLIQNTENIQTITLNKNTITQTLDNTFKGELTYKECGTRKSMSNTQMLLKLSDSNLIITKDSNTYDIRLTNPTDDIKTTSTQIDSDLLNNRLSMYNYTELYEYKLCSNIEDFNVPNLDEEHITKTYSESSFHSLKWAL